jgi:hypothetical protein
MQTFSTAIAATRTYLDEVTPKSWTDYEVKREVNNAYGELITATIEVFEDYYQRRTDFNLVTGQQEYTIADGLPTDIYKIKRVEYNPNTLSNPNAFYRAAPTNINNFRSTITNPGLGSTSFPFYYTYGFDSSFVIGFVPIPQVASANGVRLWYIYRTPILVNDGTGGGGLDDPINIPYADRYASLIPLYAAGVLLRKGQQEEPVAAKYMADFDTGKQEMMNELKQRNVDDSEIIQDSIGLNTDFSMVDLYY